MRSQKPGIRSNFPNPVHHPETNPGKRWREYHDRFLAHGRSHDNPSAARSRHTLLHAHLEKASLLTVCMLGRDADHRTAAQGEAQPRSFSQGGGARWICCFCCPVKGTCATTPAAAAPRPKGYIHGVERAVPPRWWWWCPSLIHRCDGVQTGPASSQQQRSTARVCVMGVHWAPVWFV